MKVSVLGSGMAGCGAVHRLSELGVDTVTYDMRDHFGGHTASFEIDGFTLDEGPHVSFTKNDRVMDVLAENIDGEYFEHKTKVNNHWKGHWIKHPAQVNLHGLPTDVISRCIEDFVAASHAAETPPINNYADWLLAAFGETFATTFPMEYTKKYHTTPAENMSTDWIGPRLYRPEISEVLDGALNPKSGDVHYIGEFRYPKTGGFAAYLKPFLDKTELHLGHKLEAIDPEELTLRFTNGVEHPFEKLVSSVPLPELIPTIARTPEHVLDAAELLSCSEVVIVSVGVDREDLIDAHWTYFYDEDYFFTRLSTPHMQSINNTPPGHGCIQAECYYSKKYRPLDIRPDQCIEPVVRDLRRCGIIKEQDSVVFTHAMHIPYANVIFDLDRKQALKTCHEYLDELGIGYCGRYGEWVYTWTDQAFISGERVAEKVLDG